jgi:uncharacterized protein (TIGR02246 family)
MRSNFCWLLLIAVSGALAGRAASAADPQPPAKNDADEQAIRRASDEYCAAFSKGDIDRLLALWTPDAEYIDSSGQTVRGRNNLAAFFKEELADLKGHTMKVNIAALRFFKPDLVLEDGSAELTAPDGDVTGGRYNAVWLKADGKWLLARVQDLPGDSDEGDDAGNYAHLKQLEWLIGEWTSENPATRVVASLDCRWIKNKNFVSIEEVVKAKGEETSAVTRIVGWDPAGNQLKSWVFDSQGGNGEGLGTRADHKWTFKNRSVLSDGRRATSVNSLEWLDDNTFVLRSQGRTVDEQPITGEEFKFVRKAAKPAEPTGKPSSKASGK